MCSGIDSPVFSRFLLLVGNLLDKADDSQATSVSHWSSRCEDQLKLNDVRTPPVCVAATFSLVPFPLSALKQYFMHSQSQNRNASELELITVTVDSNYKNNRAPTPKSACLHGVKMHILGKGTKNFYAKGLGFKVELLRSFMQSIPRSDSNVILFVDGSDVIFQASTDVILSRFVQSNAKILFSGEHACYPMKYFPWNINTGTWLGPCTGACSNSRFVCDSLFPSLVGNAPDPTNRWLNSGGFIGYASDIHRMLDDIASIPADMMNQWPGFDQGQSCFFDTCFVVPSTLSCHAHKVNM